MKGYIYKHTDPYGVSYIGMTTTDPKKRWNNGKGYKAHFPFRVAIKNYGWENIKHEILIEIEDENEMQLKEKLRMLEAESIIKHKTFSPYGYNCHDFDKNEFEKCVSLGDNYLSYYNKCVLILGIDNYLKLLDELKEDVLKGLRKNILFCLKNNNKRR